MLGVWAFTRFLKELTIMQEEKDNRGLKNFRRALLQVRAAIGPTIPTQLVQTFVDVALNEGKSLGELAELVGSNASTVSRHLLDLGRSEEHTSELQSLMRISYAVFCLKKKNT